MEYYIEIDSKKYYFTKQDLISILDNAISKANSERGMCHWIKKALVDFNKDWKYLPPIFTINNFGFSPENFINFVKGNYLYCKEVRYDPGSKPSLWASLDRLNERITFLEYLKKKLE